MVHAYCTNTNLINRYNLICEFMSPIDFGIIFFVQLWLMILPAIIGGRLKLHQLPSEWLVQNIELSRKALGKAKGFLLSFHLASSFKLGKEQIHSLQVICCCVEY